MSGGVPFDSGVGTQGTETEESDAMRTTIYTDPNDPDETDNFPGCHAMVENGDLVVLDEDDGEETRYRVNEWVSCEIVNDDT